MMEGNRHMARATRRLIRPINRAAIPGSLRGNHRQSESDPVGAMGVIPNRSRNLPHVGELSHAMASTARLENLEYEWQRNKHMGKETMYLE